MSYHRAGSEDGLSVSPDLLLARARAAELRSGDGIQAAIDDFIKPDDARLDERTRTALSNLLHGIVDALESEIRDHALRLLQARGEAMLAGALDRSNAIFHRLWDAGLLRDVDLLSELLARVRQEMLGNALPTHAPEDPQRPSLINRFAQHPDRLVSECALAVLIAESRRRGSEDTRRAGRTDLPAELHHRLVWRITAGLRERVPHPTEALDRALSEAAQRSLSAHDEGDRLEAAVMRFAVAVDPQPNEISALLVESLTDRRMVLFIALFAHALGIHYSLARDIILNPRDERLWVALRALELGREHIAYIGYALCEADTRRDLEQFADMLDAILAVDATEARAAIRPTLLNPDYRDAILSLQRAWRAR